MTAASTLVRDVLLEYGGIVQEAVKARLERAARSDAVYGLAADYPMRGGRALRASFCIAAARAFGAPTSDAVESAVSLELFHNAFLVRDDVEDESEERRGKPALHLLHGVPTAVNVGDALTVLGLGPLIRNRAILGPELAWRILQEAERMVRESVEGQALELRWRFDNALELTDEDYLRMTLKKTCWYTSIYPCRIGALIGTRRIGDLDRFVRFGFFVGAAFQIQDDLLNLTGDHARYGKEIDGDLREGKRTLMLICLLQRAAAGERARLRRILAQPRGEKTDADIRWIRDRMDHHEAIEYGRRVAHALAGAAQHEFNVAYADAPDSRDRRFIEALPCWVLERA
ncbi:MAG TPA: polyprenyl synthetase family protein [Polyangiaceae bacterium]|nr:polyprenyl synthetase family protein [Polyangiaceae bacterium]